MPKRKNKNKKKKKKTAPVSHINSQKSLIQVFSHPGGSSAILGNKITLAHFRVIGTADAASTTASTFVCNVSANGIRNLTIAGLGARCVAMGDLYQFFRIIDLKVVCHAQPGMEDGSAVGGPNCLGNITWLMGFTAEPNSAVTTPTNMLIFCDFPHFVWCLDNSPNGLKLHLGKKELLSSMPYEWLKCSTTGVNDEDYTQGCLWFASQSNLTSATAGLLRYVIDVVVEFRGDIDPAANPALPRYSYLKEYEYKRISKDFKESVVIDMKTQGMK